MYKLLHIQTSIAPYNFLEEPGVYEIDGQAH